MKLHFSHTGCVQGRRFTHGGENKDFGVGGYETARCSSAETCRCFVRTRCLLLRGRGSSELLAPIPVHSKVCLQISLKAPYTLWTGIAQYVWRLATGWTVRGSNSGEGDIFRTCPDHHGAHPASSTGGTGSFQGTEAKRLGRAVNYPLPQAPRLKKE